MSRWTLPKRNSEIPFDLPFGSGGILRLVSPGLRSLGRRPDIAWPRMLKSTSAGSYAT